MKKKYKKNNYPSVSVIMNCHNGEKYLKESVRSVINQSYKNWELIFWDNVSTDNSKEIVESFIDKRIKYFCSKKFTNLYEARNLAIEKASCNYIAFLDTDDKWSADKLEKQINFLNNNSQFDVIFSNYYVFNETKNTKYLKHKKPLPSGLITQSLLDYYSLGLATVLLKKNIFKKNKFENDYNIIGDFDFFIEISQNIRIASLDEPLAIYRLHKNNLSGQKIDIYTKELDSWVNKNKKKLLGKGYSISKQEQLLIKLKIKSIFKSFLEKCKLVHKK
jgi:glycosyltransferase involved in cell wall biosynthesis|tara:strand:- start:472 stop:1299 length:828 start_codon:yes stop_codon:yes gene_type:complete